ncbi:MAG TPA: hypothetical protein VIO84_15835 [Candidatus Dormibacteraeota bacterium]|jgi:hypothetical protein
MLQRPSLALGIALLLAGCGAPGAGLPGESVSESSSLSLSGPVKADFSSDKGGSCTWKPAAFELTFTTGEVQSGVKVDFVAQVGVGAVGDPDAATPPRADGLTPLVVRAGGKAIKATSGTIHVTDGDVNSHAFKGTVDAVMEDGTKVTGSWGCTATLG